MALVTTQQIKEKTAMGGNVDTDRIYHIRENVEALVLEPAIGTALYDYLVSNGGADPTNNLTGDYKTLYDDYVVAILCNAIYAEYLYDALVLGQNGGVYTHITDDGQQADRDTIDFLAKKYRSTADAYIDRMKRFLCDAGIDEYDDSQVNDYDIDPNDVSNTSGWYFPK